jgi:hypothetical protein
MITGLMNFVLGELLSGLKLEIRHTPSHTLGGYFVPKLPAGPCGTANAYKSIIGWVPEFCARGIIKSP